MQATFYSRVPYLGRAERRAWPAATETYVPEIARASMVAALDAFELADELGFDWVTVAEHHYAPICLTPNPLIMAGALSQRVKRARIALLGADIPILDPVRVAEEFAMLDNLTNGRIVAGLLRGIPTEYLTYGTNPDESRERFEEALCLIVRAWVEPQPFGWMGRYYEYRTIRIWPRPLQQPHPPIYMSGSSREASALAARARVGVGFAATSLDHACASARHYQCQAEAAGWHPTREHVLYRVPVHLARTDAEAYDTLDPEAFIVGQPAAGVGQALGQSHYRADAAGRRSASTPKSRTDVQARIERGQLLVGSPETVLRQIERIGDRLDPGVLDLHFPDLDREAILRALELFGTRVLPRLHDR
jgi:alkanesulfonate monooxygenase SsuD/methylene tetrahydromethanopterin reductase-like flavin-dependent oxidoreductase (luciferase family)